MKTLKITNRTLFFYFAILAVLNLTGVLLMALSSFFPEQTRGFLTWLIKSSTVNLLLNFSAKIPLVISVLLAIISSLLCVIRNKSYNLFSTSLALSIVGTITSWLAYFMTIQNVWTAIILFVLIYGSYVTAIVLGLIIIYKAINRIYCTVPGSIAEKIEMVLDKTV